VAGDNALKLEVDEQERRAVGRSLAGRKALLIQIAGDTAKTQAVRRPALVELEIIKPVLRKLRLAGGPRITTPPTSRILKDK
jgi:hypothetical protein